MSEQTYKVAELIWNTSRADEGTVSATGANIVAHALSDAGLIAPVARLRAFAAECVAHGDMTPAAARMLNRILDGE